MSQDAGHGRLRFPPGAEPDRSRMPVARVRLTRRRSRPLPVQVAAVAVAVLGGAEAHAAEGELTAAKRKRRPGWAPEPRAVQRARQGMPVPVDTAPSWRA